MAKLTASQRAKLPDSAFAYIDSTGGRRLPIHDEAHVRNALARFDRVAFEDDAARERARKRLLNAAKRYGIVPVGFITAQLRQVRSQGVDVSSLPTGFVTFLMTDIVGSTALLSRLGDRYGTVLRDVRAISRRAVRRAGGHEVDARADEFFAAFERPARAVAAAVALQAALLTRTWPDDEEVLVRTGIHSGRPTLGETGYIGLSVHTTARVCAVAHGGQIVLTDATRTAMLDDATAEVRFRSLGRRTLAGLPGPEALFQVEADGIPLEFPPLRTRSGARS